MLSRLLTRVFGTRPSNRHSSARLRQGYSRLLAGDASGARQVASDLLSQEPALARANLLLAQAAAADGDWPLAFNAIQRFLTVEDDHAEAYYIRGMAYEHQHNPESAIQDFARALHIDPKHAAALDRKGALHDTRGEFEDALACAQQLVRLDDQNAHAYHKLGITLRELGRLAEAEQALRAAAALGSDFHDAHSHLALVLIDQGRFEEAETLLQHVLNTERNHPEGRWTNAVLNLLRGRFDIAWDDYEWRETRRDTPSRIAGIPEWNGSRIDNGYLLIFPEQGLGDQIMFASCIGDALRLSPACIVECDQRLEALFRRSFPSAAVVPASASWPPKWLQSLTLPIVAQIPAGSLPAHFRRHASDFPLRDRYLVPDQTAVAQWQERLSRLGAGPKIGLSWTGGGAKTRRRLRSLAMEQLLPLFQAGACQFVSLQYVDSTAEIRAMHERHDVLVHEFEDAHATYDQTAALVGALDLVISVCTAVIHLAGAIGTPVWIMAPAAPEWRYLASGTQMPWYSSATIWRQQALGEWEDMVSAIASQLAAYCNAYAIDAEQANQYLRPRAPPNTADS